MRLLSEKNTEYVLIHTKGWHDGYEIGVKTWRWAFAFGFVTGILFMVVIA